MKRSEVIKLISRLIDSGRDWDLETRADKLLCHLEEMGIIKPPKYYVTGWDSMFDEPMRIYRNGWEAEDSGKRAREALAEYEKWKG